MRKETLIIRVIVILAVCWVSLICLKKLLYKKNYTRIDGLPSQYPLENVYSKPMTKLEIRENLGRSTWTLLHTMASVYPGIPSEQHKKDVLKFIYLLSKLYPCGDCAQHFQKLIKGFPPKIGNHDEFVEWLCRAHNIVNKRIGKTEFDCARVEERWECGCEGT
ncbi:hypothetical protein COBT_000667 [Conglomerata obtusa]